MDTFLLEVRYIVASLVYLPFVFFDGLSGPSTYGGSGDRLHAIERFFGCP